jgi:cysteine synthase
MTTIFCDYNLMDLEWRPQYKGWYKNCGDDNKMNILGQIGNTPLLKLTRVIESSDVDIYVKCEFLNPGGSIKDRMALRMIEGAEQSGELKPGGTIVEQSTGNTGPALA